MFYIIINSYLSLYAFALNVITDTRLSKESISPATLAVP